MKEGRPEPPSFRKILLQKSGFFIELLGTSVQRHTQCGDAIQRRVWGNLFAFRVTVIQQLARNTADRLDYFDTLDEEIINTSYRREVSQARNIVQQLLLQLRVSGSPELRSSVEAILGNHLYLLPDQDGRLPG